MITQGRVDVGRGPRAPRRPRWLAGVAACVVAAFALAGCSGAFGEGLNPQTLPPEVRPQYDLFAQRCSRCHSLARPLAADFSTMEQWRRYVRRMRRQPNSGISEADEAEILTFLAYYHSTRPARRGEAAP